MGWFSSGKCTSTARLDGKTAVVTGCNTGIGKYTVLDLYGRGARVVMACRNIEKAEETRKWIIEQKAGQKGVGELAVCHLDLSSLSSVHECAEKLYNEEMRINILINNAGVMMCPRLLTTDGYELQFATNHLGHFLFTLKLLFKIIGSGPSRINMSSSSHRWCKSMDFKDINLEKSYSPQQSYFRSKLANVLFSRELAKRLEGTKVTVYSVHPGAVDAELQPTSSSIWKIFYYIASLFLNTPEQGAQTTIYCAVDEKAAKETGLYYADCKAETPSAMALDDQVAMKLWDISLDMVKLSPPWPFGKSSTAKRSKENV
uniref:Uncharacterized protein n=1 Tax=Homalodisca liturata TaxID=320908 RepID=A0A1B6HK17_9HEMI